MLSVGQADNHSVKLARHFDLAGETRVGLRSICKTQHAGFGIADEANLVEPCVLDVDVTGAASAFPPTVAVNTGNAIAYRSLHHRFPFRQFDFVPRPVLFNVNNSGHRQSLVFDHLVTHSNWS